MKTKEETLTDVMKIQSNYDFLGHNTRTKQSSRELIKKLNERVKRIQSKLLTFILILGLGSSLISCNKDFNDPTPPTKKRELVSVKIGLSTQIKDQPMNKSFNPDVWVYNYSDVPYTLTFKSKYDTYTEAVSVQEIKNGQVIMTMVLGDYTVTYNPIHGMTYSDKIDVSINMSGVQVNGSDITLSGDIEDGLIIVDIPKTLLFPFPNGIKDDRGTSFPTLFYNEENDFYYGYTDIKPVHPLTMYFNDNSFGLVDIPGTFQKGHIYWMTKNKTGTVNLTFPDLIVDRVTL